MAEVISPFARRQGAESRLDRQVLEAAAEWHVRTKYESDADAAGLDAWLEASDLHRTAWSLVQRLDLHLGGLPTMPAISALAASGQMRKQRRAVLKGVLLLAGSASLGWTAHSSSSWQIAAAGYSTRPGERRSVQLADGGTVELNTDTALDVVYDAERRLIRMYEGEVLIQTAADRAVPSARPFFVQTPHGSIRALGTRFSVRVEDGRSSVAVLEHAVEVVPKNGGPAVRIEAGEQVSFSSIAIDALHPANQNQVAWTRGMLVAVEQPLADFLAELSRYRRGRIECDPAVAGLLVTGAYRIDDTDHVLDSLTLSHPVSISRFTRFWVSVAPRA